MAELQLANENPWYVLMTLCGEQFDNAKLGFVPKITEKNTTLWNIWACQNLTEKEREQLRNDGAEVPNSKAWDENKDEIETLFKKEWAERNPDHVGEVTIPSPSKLYDLSATQFSRRIVLNGAIFCHELTFNRCKFEGNVHCERAVFLNRASFHETSFDGSSFFFEAKFNGEAWFRRAVFQKHSSFNSINFVEKVDFRSVKFSSVSFQDSTFEKDAIFNVFIANNTNFFETNFKGKAHFAGARLAEHVTFTQAIFESEVSFRQTEFGKTASFRGAQFHNSVSFQAVSFSGVAEFNNGYFICSNVEGKTFPIDFRHASFERPADFRRCTFFTRYPDFSGILLHERSLFSAKKKFWPASAANQIDEAKNTCATLRHIVAKQSLPDDEYFFFRREMKFMGQSSPMLVRLFFWVYRVSSDYGYSIGRPIVGLALLWLLGFILFQGCWASDAFCAFDPPKARLLSSADAAGFSGSNIFKFFGFQRTYFLEELEEIEKTNPGLLNLAALQTVLGYILLFFLGLGLRARFRLR